MNKKTVYIFIANYSIKTNKNMIKAKIKYYLINNKMFVECCGYDWWDL